MRHFKEHLNHKYNKPEKEFLNLQGYTGKIEKVKNVHFKEHLFELEKKKCVQIKN